MLVVFSISPPSHDTAHTEPSVNICLLNEWKVWANKIYYIYGDPLCIKDSIMGHEYVMGFDSSIKTYHRKDTIYE